MSECVLHLFATETFSSYIGHSLWGDDCQAMKNLIHFFVGQRAYEVRKKFDYVMETLREHYWFLFNDEASRKLHMYIYLNCIH